MNRYIFKFDAEVYGLDKQCGRLAKVVVDPQTWQLTDLIIENGFLFKRAKVIPLAKFKTIETQALYLAINSDELVNYPDYEKTVIEKGVPKWQPPPAQPDYQGPVSTYSPTDVPEMTVARETLRTGVADDLLALDEKTSVRGLENNIGSLSHIVAAETFQIHHFVVAQGKLLPRPLVVPIQLVEEISDNHIRILATEAEINEFDEFVLPSDQSQEAKADSRTPSEDVVS